LPSLPPSLPSTDEQEGAFDGEGGKTEGVRAGITGDPDAGRGGGGGGGGGQEGGEDGDELLFFHVGRRGGKEGRGKRVR
jgi:hypothetical protein